MTHEELYNAARRQPFGPFRIILTMGESYDIRHPDLIMVGRRSATIGITKATSGPIYDQALVVDLLHVVAIQDLSVSSSTTNGSP